MTTAHVLGVALGLTARAWRSILAVYLAGLALALVLGSVLHGAIASSLGTSLAGERMRLGFDPFWFNSFSAQATGVAASLRPSASGAGAVFDGLDAFFDGFLGLLFGPGNGVLPAALAYLVLWSVASGGFIAMGSTRRVDQGILATAARHAPGILCLSMVGLAAFSVLLGPIRFRLDAAIEAGLRDEIDERVRFGWILGEYLALWAVAWVVRIVLDYAKVAVVRRPSGGSLAAVPAALWRGLVFVTRHPIRTAGLQAGLGLVWLATLAAYVLLVPGAAVSSLAGVAGTFLFGQAFIVSRAYLRAASYVGAAALVDALEPHAADAAASTAA